MAGTVKGQLQHGIEFARAVGSEDAAAEAGGAAAGRDEIGAVAHQRNDGQVAGFAHGTDEKGENDPVHIGKGEIEENEIDRGTGAEARKGGFARIGPQSGTAELLDEEAGNAGACDIGVDDKDARPATVGRPKLSGFHIARHLPSQSATKPGKYPPAMLNEPLKAGFPAFSLPFPVLFP